MARVKVLLVLGLVAVLLVVGFGIWPRVANSPTSDSVTGWEVPIQPGERLGGGWVGVGSTLRSLD